MITGGIIMKEEKCEMTITLPAQAGVPVPPKMTIQQTSECSIPSES